MEIEKVEFENALKYEFCLVESMANRYPDCVVHSNYATVVFTKNWTMILSSEMDGRN